MLQPTKYSQRLNHCYTLPYVMYRKTIRLGFKATHAVSVDHITGHGSFGLGQRWNAILPNKWYAVSVKANKPNLWYTHTAPLRIFKQTLKKQLTAAQVMDFGFFFPGTVYDYYANQDRLFFFDPKTVLQDAHFNAQLKFQNKTMTPYKANPLTNKLKINKCTQFNHNTTALDAIYENDTIKLTTNNQRSLNANTPKPSENFYIIKQFRFKPGLSIKWREYRRHYISLQRLKIFRQQKLTKYIVTAKRIVGFNTFKQLALSVFYLARLSNLLPFYAFTHTQKQHPLMVSHFLLNNKTVEQPLTQVYIGDVITIAHNISSNLSFFSQNAPMGFGRPVLLKQMGFQYTWKLRNIQPTPWFMEVDDSLGVAILLAEPKALSELPVSLFTTTFFMGIKLLNWKYRS